MTGGHYPGKNGGARTFLITWHGCDPVATTWLGQYNYSTKTFLTLWYLSLATKLGWNGIDAGSDIFKPHKQNEAIGEPHRPGARPAVHKVQSGFRPPAVHA